MFAHYLKFFFRNLIRNKAYTIINILGLSTGMAVSILILLYVFYEVSYDRFIPEGGQKYRVVTQFAWSESFFEAPRSGGELGNLSKEQIPEVIRTATIIDAYPYIMYQDKLIREEDGDAIYASGEIFEFFGIELIHGNPDHLLEDPYTVVLSESKARKYFGDEPAIGKVLVLNPVERSVDLSTSREEDKSSNIELRVSGLFRDYPENTSQSFGMIIPMELYRISNNLTSLRDHGNSFVNYIKLRGDADISRVEEKMAEITLSMIPEKLQQSMNIDVKHVLQPIRRIHLFSDFSGFNEVNTGGRIVYVYVFSAIAVFILLLAAINFMNLSTARYTGRAKEVSLRKINGATRKTLIRQFLGESVTISMVSLFTAMVLAELFLPVFNSLIDMELKFNYLQQPSLFIGFIVLGLVTGLISGSYPAFFLSRFRPLEILRGRITKNKSGRRFRWTLVIFQFVIALVLATCTLIVYKQLNYVKNKNLGFNKEHVLMFILRGNEIREKMDVFKHRLDQIPQVENYTFSLDRPGIRTSWFGNYKFEGDGEAEHPAFPAVSIDERFFETFGMQLMEGRNFSVDMASDSGAMIVNEAMVKYLGWEDPIGKSVYEMAADYDRERFQVIGVVKDFHMESLHKSIEPVIFKFERMQPRWCFIRLRPGDPSETIQAVEEAWSDVVPGREISTYFLNAAYDSEYRSEQQFGKIFIYFTLFALFIAGLGIVGLVSYITASRTREIGIRKVMGAGTTTILRLLSMDFVKMIAVALVISIPVSYLIMDKWLERFAYTTSLSFWIFLLSGFIALLVALLSTAVQTIRAASQNPADTIRYE